MTILASNIRLLRKEAFLTTKQLAEELSVTEALIKDWEKGVSEPNDQQLIRLCKILKMPYEDIRDRDMETERNEALRAMKSSTTRRVYNWYFGEKKWTIFRFSYLAFFVIGVALVILLASWFTAKTDFSGLVGNDLIYARQTTLIVNLIHCASPFCFISGAFMVIWLIIKEQINLRWWYLFLLPLISSMIQLAGTLLTIPFLIYTIICLVRKKK